MFICNTYTSPIRYLSLPHDVWWLAKVISRSHNCSKGCISLMEHVVKFGMKRLYSKSYMVFQCTPWHLTLGGIERSNQGHWVFIQLHWALYYRPCIIRQWSSQAERLLVWVPLVRYGRVPPPPPYDWIIVWPANNRRWSVRSWLVFN